MKFIPYSLKPEFIELFANIVLASVISLAYRFLLIPTLAFHWQLLALMLFSCLCYQTSSFFKKNAQHLQFSLSKHYLLILAIIGFTLSSFSQTEPTELGFNFTQPNAIYQYLALKTLSVSWGIVAIPQILREYGNK